MSNLEVYKRKKTLLIIVILLLLLALSYSIKDRFLDAANNKDYSASNFLYQGTESIVRIVDAGSTNFSSSDIEDIKNYMSNNLYTPVVYYAIVNETEGDGFFSKDGMDGKYEVVLNVEDDIVGSSTWAAILVYNSAYDEYYLLTNTSLSSSIGFMSPYIVTDSYNRTTGNLQTFSNLYTLVNNELKGENPVDTYKKVHGYLSANFDRDKLIDDLIKQSRSGIWFAYVMIVLFSCLPILPFSFVYYENSISDYKAKHTEDFLSAKHENFLSLKRKHKNTKYSTSGLKSKKQESNDSTVSNHSFDESVQSPQKTLETYSSMTLAVVNIATDLLKGTKNGTISINKETHSKLKRTYDKEFSYRCSSLLDLIKKQSECGIIQPEIEMFTRKYQGIVISTCNDIMNIKDTQLQAESLIRLMETYAKICTSLVKKCDSSTNFDVGYKLDSIDALAKMDNLLE